MVRVVSKIVTEQVLAAKNNGTLEEKIYEELLTLAEMDTEQIEFIPYGYLLNTAQNVNTAQPLYKTAKKTFNFIVQNKGASGSGNLNIGGVNQPAGDAPISVPPANMFFFTFTQSNYVTDLNKWTISSSTASQSYGILLFQRA